jgi:asparagine synthase (glutamine-hydrolysing)
MCGIAGILAFPPGLGRLADRVTRMLDLLLHRGPDDAGVWSNGRVALGNRRLVILDLSRAGHQPMISADGNVCVIQNGELYNFAELRRELKQAGYAFRSCCDTEVLLHGYAHWGVELFRRLRGMFAIALWSERERQLILARDRLGIKPLYFGVRRENGRSWLAFASEIKPLLADLPGSPRPNVALVHDFLAYGLMDHTCETFFEGVEKVPPAHHLIFDGDGKLSVCRYWDFQVNPVIRPVSRACDRREAAAFRDLFLDAVEHHLVSDVPIGACLSGGLDSSAIVCAASGLVRGGSLPRSRSRCAQTFTSCFPDARYDERTYAQEVVEATQAQAHFTFPTAQGFLADLPQLLYHQEEPIGSTSQYAHWCVMRDVHRHGLKVVLNGQGGDEQLLGYGKFYLFYLQALARKRLRQEFCYEAASLVFSPQFWGSLHFREGLRYMGRLARLSGEMTFVNPVLASRLAERKWSVGLQGCLAERIKQDLTTFSLPVLLRYEDKSSMAFSVEARVPFVDHVLVEHVAALPINQKLRRGWTKFVLRAGLKGILPALIRQRKSKMGFETPEDVWVRQDFAPAIEQTFATAKFLPDWADLPRLTRAYAAYRLRPGLTSQNAFFRYFVVEQWARQFLTTNHPTPAGPAH